MADTARTTRPMPEDYPLIPDRLRALAAHLLSLDSGSPEGKLLNDAAFALTDALDGCDANGAVAERMKRERDAARATLELIRQDAWTHPADYETDRRIRLERIAERVRALSTELGRPPR